MPLSRMLGIAFSQGRWYPDTSRFRDGLARKCLLLASGLAADPSLLSSFSKLPIALCEDLPITAQQFVHRSNIPQGAVQADVVVVENKISHCTPGILQAQR